MECGSISIKNFTFICIMFEESICQVCWRLIFLGRFSLILTYVCTNTSYSAFIGCHYNTTTTSNSKSNAKSKDTSKD